MGVFTRRLIKENLDQVSVFLEDTRNEIFVVQDLPDTFGQGRTAFKIFGSSFLKDNVPLKIELLDKNGETVFLQPVYYGESGSPVLPYRYVSVEVYRDINIGGEAKLTILGELDPSVTNVPQEFQNTYNVKFSKIVNIDIETSKNNQPIIFYKKPTFTAQEVVTRRKKSNPGFNTQVSGSQIYGRVKQDLRGKSVTTGHDVNTQIDTSVGGKSETPYGDVKKQVESYKYKTGLFGKPAILSKRGLKQERASAEPPQMKIFSNENGKFNSKMVGGTINVNNVQLSDTQLLLLSGEETTTSFGSTVPVSEKMTTIRNRFTIPSYTATIDKVVSDTELHTSKPYSVTYNKNGFVKRIYSDISLTLFPSISNIEYANFTSSFTDWDAPTTSSFHFDSFVDLTLRNLRTFSGDVYRIKVYGASDDSTSDFPVLLDTIIESPELLRDTTSPSGFLRSGYFIEQSHIEKYWKSFGGNNNTATLNPVVTQSLIDSVFLSGSYENYSEVGRFETDNTYPFTVKKDVPYTLSFNAIGRVSNKNDANGVTSKSAKLLFHLSGSNLSSYDGKKPLTYASSFGATITDENNKLVGLEINEDNLPPNNGDLRFGKVEHTFFPKFKLDKTTNTDTILQMRIDSGEWIISDVSLRPAQDTGFSPDEFLVRVPIPEGANNSPNNFDFLIEYYDIDGNVAETATYIDDVKISGSALIIQGTNNMLTGSLFLGSLQGSGIEIHGGSAFLRAVGYKGFKSASAGQGGGFFIWSGSAKPGGETQDNYTGAGLEIHDGNTGVNESFFKFRTIDADNDFSSSFDIKTSRFFLGQENSNFVSGALGNIEISSSNFHLDNTGDVTMAGTIQATAGKIGDFNIINGQISGSNITLNANNSTIFKTDQGPGSDSSAAFPQLRNEFYIDFSPTVENPDNFFVKFGPNFMVDKDGILIASGATFEGAITASKGLIGGFTSDDDSFFSGTKSSPSFFISGSATGTGQDKKNLVISSSGFTVNSQGEIQATAGTVGGFKLSTSTITGSNLIIDDSGELRTKNYDPNLAGWLISARDNGFAEFENVKIRGTLRTAVFEKETVNAVGGQLYIANSTAITGSSVTPSTTAIQVDNVSGFIPGEIIFAKKVTGTGFTKEFMKIFSASRADESSDNNFSGFLHVTRSFGMDTTGSAYSNATNLDGAITSTSSTRITLNSNSGLNRRTIRVGDELMAVSSSVGSTIVNVRRGVSGTKKTTHADDAVVQLLSRDAAIVANVVNPAESYDEGQVLVSTGRFDGGAGNNTTGSGYIHMNANPGENVTPYVDFVERTGSGIYDAKLRLRLGDLTGIVGSRLGDEVSITDNPGFGLASENVFLSGLIKANSGSIGGIKMQSDKIFTGNEGGVHGSANTGFFANSSGNFSLGNKFKFTNSTGELLVSGSNVKVETPSFFLGDSSQFVSGSNNLLEISSSKFHIQNDGDVIMNDITASNANVSGKITSTTGEIGGFTIGNDSLSNGNFSVNSVNGAGSIILAGTNTFGADGFHVSFNANAGGTAANTKFFVGDNDGSQLKFDGSNDMFFRFGADDAQRIEIDGTDSELTFKNSAGTELFKLTGSLSRSFWRPENSPRPNHLPAHAFGGYFSRSGSIFIEGDQHTYGSNTLTDNCIILSQDQQIFHNTNHTGNYPFLVTNWGDDTVGRDLTKSQQLAYFYNYREPETIFESAAAGTKMCAIVAETQTDHAGLIGARTGSAIDAILKASTAQQARGIDVTVSGPNSTATRGINISVSGGSNDYGLYSNRRIASEGDIIAFVSSDKRLKTNITKIESSLDKIIKLNGVSFEWKQGYDENVQNKTNLGVIAQDVREVIPEIVKERKDGYLAVQYDQLVPVLIEAVKDQQKQIDELKKKLEEL